MQRIDPNRDVVNRRAQESDNTCSFQVSLPGQPAAGCH
jgi:hypothetical protein